MKAVVYDAPGQYTIREVPTPDPGPGEVRVRVQQTGICGTDLHIHNGKFFAEFPLTPGHELIGPVDALGEGTEDTKRRVRRDELDRSPAHSPGDLSDEMTIGRCPPGVNDPMYFATGAGERSRRCRDVSRQPQQPAHM